MHLFSRKKASQNARSHPDKSNRTKRIRISFRKIYIYIHNNTGDLEKLYLHNTYPTEQQYINTLYSHRIGYWYLWNVTIANTNPCFKHLNHKRKLHILASKKKNTYQVLCILKTVKHIGNPIYTQNQWLNLPQAWGWPNVGSKHVAYVLINK